MLVHTTAAGRLGPRLFSSRYRLVSLGGRDANQQPGANASNAFFSGKSCAVLAKREASRRRNCRLLGRPAVSPEILRSSAVGLLRRGGGACPSRGPFATPYHYGGAKPRFSHLYGQPDHSSSRDVRWRLHDLAGDFSDRARSNSIAAALVQQNRPRTDI